MIILVLSDDDYKTLKARYEPAAEKLEEYICKLLEVAGIKALLSHRVKELKSLNKKLERPKYNNASRDNVPKRIKDIAGVRVAVYYPSDKWEVEALLYEYFRDVTQTTHPTEKEKKMVSSAMRFEGYSAEHYVIPIAKEPTPDIKRRLPNHTSSLDDAARRLRERPDPDNVKKRDWSSVRVELQVASLPLHTWSEPNHTLVYKEPKADEARDTEPTWVRESRKRAILDALNGLAVDGEVLLEMLKWESIKQEPFSTRRFYDVFRNDLALFLERIRGAKNSCWFIGQNLYGLFYDQDRKPRYKTRCAILQSSCKIKFVIADCNNKAVREDVMYGWGPQFMDDWKESFKMLLALKNASPQRVEAYLSTQVSRQSLLFFDPECSDGEVFLIRSLPGTKPEQRPTTRIRRNQHPTRFKELLKKWPKQDRLKGLPNVM